MYMRRTKTFYRKRESLVSNPFFNRIKGTIVINICTTGTGLEETPEATRNTYIIVWIKDLGDVLSFVSFQNCFDVVTAHD